MSNREMPPLPQPALEQSEVGEAQMPSLDTELFSEAEQSEVEMKSQPPEMPKALDLAGPAPVEPVKPQPLRPIKVRAINVGFYKKERRMVNAEFYVDTFEQLGTWMMCIDPIIQKKHEAAMKKRKEQMRKSSVLNSAGE